MSNIDEEKLTLIHRRLGRFLGQRERSRSEVESFLLGKLKLKTEEVGEVIESLILEGQIDDDRFAKKRAEYRKRQGFGPKRIQQELRALHVRNESIELALADLDEVEFLENAKDLAENELTKHLSQPDAESKIRQRLMARGFGGAQIQKSMQHLKEKFPHWARRTTIAPGWSLEANREDDGEDRDFP